MKPRLPLQGRLGSTTGIGPWTTFGMGSALGRRLWLSAVFVVVAVTTVMGVVATVSRRQAEEREERAALVRAADLLRGVVDESLEELRAREDARPFDQFNEVYRPEGVVAASDAVAPSPLSRAPDDRRLLGWFQVNPDGTLTLPHEHTRPDAARRIREVILSRDLAPVRALAKPVNGQPVADVDPELALLDSQLGYAEKQSVQELNAASREVYKQLKEAEPEPQKRAALAENPKLPNIGRNDIDWTKADLDNLGTRAKPVKKSKLPSKKSKEDVAIDYTPMVFDTLAGQRVLHRVVSKGGSSTVQGVVLDEEAVRASWLPGLLQRRVGMAPTILSHDAAAVCTLRTPISEVLDDLDLCFSEPAEPWFPAAEVGLLASLFLLVVAALIIIDRAAARADALSRQKSAFISAVSHELRTPLTTLRMHAELMRDGLVTDPAKQRRFHDDMVKESVRLGHLVENVLEAQRLEEGRRPLRLATLDLGEVVADIAASQRALCESRGFTISCDLPPDDVALTGSFDRQGVEQIIVNLVENAVKYAGDSVDKSVAVVVARLGDDVVVVVSDHGPGVPDAEREKVFQRFHRVLRAGEDHIAGTGLGLALVRELARAHGGDARVVPNNEGRGREGCSVEVRLPLR